MTDRPRIRLRTDRVVVLRYYYDSHTHPWTVWNGWKRVALYATHAEAITAAQRIAVARPSWDEYGLGLAKAASIRGDCTRRQVGAVVMDQNHRIVGAGYNGYPSGEPGCLSDGACPRGRLTYEQAPPGTNYGGTGCRAVHAEVNAVEHALSGGSASKLTVYITDEPCEDCRDYLTDQTHHVYRVVWPTGSIGRSTT